MRLIDANKLLQKKWKVETKDMWHMTKTVDVVSAIDIEEAPTVATVATVESIPVEWIIELSNRLKNDEYDFEKAMFLLDLVDLWEKENEK